MKDGNVIAPYQYFKVYIYFNFIAFIIWVTFYFNLFKIVKQTKVESVFNQEVYQDLSYSTK